MKRTFRHPAGARFTVPLVICAAPGIGLLFAPATPAWAMGSVLIGAPVLFFVMVQMGWAFWGAYVRVDDAGIHWKEGKERGGLRWEDVSGMEAVANRSRLDLALIAKADGARHVLPVLRRPLYEILKSRFGPLPERDEQELENRWRAFP